MIATEHTIEQAAELLRESDMGGLPFACRFAPGNFSAFDVAFSRVAYNAHGEHGPFLVVSVFGFGSWAFRLADDAPYPDYVAEKLRLSGPDACAVHLLIAAALGSPAACTLADAHIESQAA